MSEPMTPERLAEIRARADAVPTGSATSHIWGMVLELLYEIERLRDEEERYDEIDKWAAELAADLDVPDDLDPYFGIDRIAREDARIVADDMERLTAELYAARAEVERLRPVVEELGRYVDWLRKSLCDICKAGICSAHQPASGLVSAIGRAYSEEAIAERDAARAEVERLRGEVARNLERELERRREMDLDSSEEQPPAGERRQLARLVGVRLLPEEYEAGRTLAGRGGMTLPAFLRGLLRDRLEEVKEDTVRPG